MRPALRGLTVEEGRDVVKLLYQSESPEDGLSLDIDGESGWVGKDRSKQTLFGTQLWSSTNVCSRQMGPSNAYSSTACADLRSLPL